jgi:hypothetical protein
VEQQYMERGEATTFLGKRKKNIVEENENESADFRRKIDFCGGNKHS